MLWWTDSCQSRVSADQYHLTVSRAQVSTPRGQVFFWSYPLTTYWFSNDRMLKVIFFKKIHIKNMLCLCAAQLKFDFKLTSDAKIQPAATGGQDSCFWLFSPCSRVGHTRKKFMQHLETCLLWQLRLTEFFVNLSCFNCLFPLDVQNEIQLLSGVFCYSWPVCLLGFWLRNTSLVKVGNPISDGIVFVFTLLNA